MQSRNRSTGGTGSVHERNGEPAVRRASETRQVAGNSQRKRSTSQSLVWSPTSIQNLGFGGGGGGGDNHLDRAVTVRHREARVGVVMRHPSHLPARSALYRTHPPKATAGPSTTSPTTTPECAVPLSVHRACASPPASSKAAAGASSPPGDSYLTRMSCTLLHSDFDPPPTGAERTSAGIPAQRLGALTSGRRREPEAGKGLSAPPVNVHRGIARRGPSSARQSTLARFGAFRPVFRPL